MDPIFIPILVALITIVPGVLSWQVKKEARATQASNASDHQRVVTALTKLETTLDHHGVAVGKVEKKVDHMDKKLDDVATTVAVNVSRIDRLEHS